MPEPREIEIKFDIPAASVRRLIGSSLLQANGDATRRARLVSTYFDTENLKLRQRGLSLRVRRVGDRLVQTVKREDAGAAVLFDRAEWENEIQTEQPDIAPGTVLADMVKKKLRRHLNPIFETHIQRTIFELHRGDSEIEISIDKGHIKADGRSSPLCGIELELKHGNTADLFALARALTKDLPAQLAIKSKADLGYALIAGDAPSVVKAPDIVLPRRCSAADALKIIGRSCLHHLLANKGLMLESNPDALHQMRVALRRLRAAISLFSEMLSDPQTERVTSDLKWISSELGPARELEVFTTQVMAPGKEPAAPGMDALSEEVRRTREDAYKRAHAAVESPRFRELVLETLAWIETGEWLSNPAETASRIRETPVKVISAQEMQIRRKKILKRGRNLEALDPERRHKLRIQAKKLRYAAEFFGSVFTGKKALRQKDEFVACLSKLQDALGGLNDIAVHENLSGALIHSAAGTKRRSAPAKKAFAAGRLAGLEEARAIPLLKQAERAYSEFSRAKTFWN